MNEDIFESWTDDPPWEDDDPLDEFDEDDDSTDDDLPRWGWLS